jgi:hypothetical protein
MHDKEPVKKRKEEANKCTGLTMRMYRAKDRLPRRKRRSTAWWSEWHRLDWTERKVWLVLMRTGRADFVLSETSPEDASL